MLLCLNEVVIRTNSASTTLTVDAEHDTVAHYGEAGFLDIIKVNTASYHEFGDILGNINLVSENGYNIGAYVYGERNIGEITSIKNTFTLNNDKRRLQKIARRK